MEKLRVAALFLGHLALNVAANGSFNLSAASSDWRSFLLWQVVGNVAGFGCVLVLTGILRTIPLHVAFPVTQGLAVVGVQVVAARLFFRETIELGQWLGTGLVVAGIVLISTRR